MLKKIKLKFFNFQKSLPKKKKKKPSLPKKKKKPLKKKNEFSRWWDEGMKIKKDMASAQYLGDNYSLPSHERPLNYENSKLSLKDEVESYSTFEIFLGVNLSFLIILSIYNVAECLFYTINLAAGDPLKALAYENYIVAQASPRKNFWSFLILFLNFSLVQGGYLWFFTYINYNQLGGLVVISYFNRFLVRILYGSTAFIIAVKHNNSELFELKLVDNIVVFVCKHAFPDNYETFLFVLLTFIVLLVFEISINYKTFIFFLYFNPFFQDCNAGEVFRKLVCYFTVASIMLSITSYIVVLFNLGLFFFIISIFFLAALPISVWVAGLLTFLCKDENTPAITEMVGELPDRLVFELYVFSLLSSAYVYFEKCGFCIKLRDAIYFIAPLCLDFLPYILPCYVAYKIISYLVRFIVRNFVRILIWLCILYVIKLVYFP